MDADDDYSAHDDNEGLSRIYGTIFLCILIAIGLATFA